MKRYGYKFLTPDSAQSKASALRQTVFFVGIPVCALCIILMPNELKSTASLFLVTGFTYAFISLIAEVLPKIGFSVAATLPWVLIGYIFWLNFVVYREPFTLPEPVVLVSYILLIGYFIAITYVSIKLLFKQFTVNKARQNRPSGWTR